MLSIDELLAFAETQKDLEMATCIEAVEIATKQNPKITDENVLENEKRGFATNLIGK